MAMAQEQLVLRGTMRSHTDWVTDIAAPIDNSDTIVTTSRDKSLILWNLTKEDSNYGVASRRFTGHSHFIQDVVLSSDGQFALSASWDAELRLWDLQTGETACRFVGHTKDVLSVAFSADNRQIVSASRDKTIKLWNTLGECKYTIQDNDSHSDSAYIWLDLNQKDIKARLSALKKSQKGASILAERSSRIMTSEKLGAESVTRASELESHLMQQWRSLFQHMSNIWEAESNQLEASLLPQNNLKDKCKAELELLNDKLPDKH